jgi:hypothetical protein
MRGPCDPLAARGRIASFERLSPTDFALTPGGVLGTMLSTLPAEPDAPLERITRMIIETVDPCLPTHLEVGHA